MIKAIFGIGCAMALFVAMATAQTSSTTTSTTAGGTTETTTTETTGTVSDFTPGASIVVNTSTGTPTTYKFHKSVTYVTADGKVIEASKIKKSSKVRVHYLKEGNDMLVDRVIVTD